MTDDIRHYLTHVAGVKHFNADGTSRQRSIRELEPHVLLRLEEEPDNLHDPHAVRVCLQDGRQLGYLPKELAREISQRRQEGCWHRAVVCKAHEVTASQVGGQVAEGGHYLRVDILVAEAEEYVTDHHLYEYLDTVGAEVIKRLNAPPSEPVRAVAPAKTAQPAATAKAVEKSASLTVQPKAVDAGTETAVRPPFWSRVASWFGGAQKVEKERR